jgi:hypothetical protein
MLTDAELLCRYVEGEIFVTDIESRFDPLRLLPPVAGDPMEQERVLAATDVLARVVPYGDIDLSGTITRDDVALMDLGYALYQAGSITAGSANWLRGDVTYDGIVDGADFFQLDRAMASLGLSSQSCSFS